MTAYKDFKTKYSFKNGKAVLERAEGEGEKLILPNETQGVSITTLGRYSLSDLRELKEAVLPEYLESIESLAFYNDRALKRLDLPQSLYRIGGDAFKNCDGIEEVIIRSERLLRYILNELGQELTVVFKEDDKIKWKLLFPIEAESFSEDVPGRAFHRTFTGPGYAYRREAVGSKVDFKRFDSLFKRSSEEETEETLCLLAIYRLIYNTGLAKDYERDYAAYLKANALKGGKYFFDRGLYEELSFMLENKLFSTDDAREMLSYVRAKGSAEFAARLMDYLGKSPKPKKTFEL